MSITRRIAAVGVLARANFGVFERPDRMISAMVSAASWGPSVTGALAAAVAREPGRIAVIDDEGSLTYAELWCRSDGIAHCLLKNGAGPGIAVGVLCRNHRGFAEAITAVAKTGADLVLLNTGFAAPQLADVVRAEDLTIVIHDDDFDDQLASCAARVLVDRDAMAHMAESGKGVSPTRHQGRTIILTSGTTGRPKGATRSVGMAAMEGVASLLARIPLRARDVQVIAAPMFHAWGLSHLMLGLGRCATTIVAPKFDAEATLAGISEHRARVLVVVPVMLQRIMTVPGQRLAQADTSALRVVAVSGSALGGPLATTVADRWGRVLYNAYGSTEVAVATVATPTDLRRRPSTVGRPAPGVRVEILDDEARHVPDGTVGRIFVGNTARFDGYTGGGGKETHRGLLSSGDVGHFDADHLLYVDGRDDDMIVSGGENVFPSEVEDLISSHEGIAEVAVIGVEDADFGQALAAFVVARHRSRVDEAMVKQYVRDNLARFKVPKHVYFLDELPRNATGKVLKRNLVSP